MIFVSTLGDRTLISPYHKRLAHIRDHFPRAYDRWSDDEESRLLGQIAQGATIDQISQLLERQPSAIRSRLRKLGYSDNSVAALDSDSSPHVQPMLAKRPSVVTTSHRCGESFRSTIEFTFEWRPVYRYEGLRYLFPEHVTSYMNQVYRGPAVYRWKILDRLEDSPCAVYIGMTKRLCPDRLNGYLEPTNSTTNRRLSDIFLQSLQQGQQVHLDVLHVEQVTIDGDKWSSFDLGSQLQRSLVESLIIERSQRSGLVLLNSHSEIIK